MDFFPELRVAGISYTVHSSFAKILPTSKQERTTFHVRIYFPEGEPLERHFAAASEVNNDVRAMIVTMLKGEKRAAALMQRWFAYRGNVPVKLTDGLVEDDTFPEAIHTALRKSSQSKQARIIWNAIHSLHSQEGADFWAMCKKSLLTAFEARAGKAPPTRRQIAKVFRDDVLEFFDSRSVKYVKVKNREVEKDEAQQFAHIAMNYACQLTDMDDWMWGWLGFALTDLPETAGVSEAQDTTQ